MGLFGLFYTLFAGGAHVANSISIDIKDDEARERARQRRDITYISHDGERLVSNNHKVIRAYDGISDYKTGEMIVDYKKNAMNAAKKEVEEFNEKSKKEAIIKGEPYYRFKCIDVNGKVDESGRRGRYYKLVVNNMPVVFTGLETRLIKRKIPKPGYSDMEFLVVGGTELNFGFIYIMPGEYSEGTYGKYTREMAKKYNTKSFVQKACIYPIDFVEWIYEYCKKYDIPIGTWEEINELCLKEHPLGWKQPPMEEHEKKRGDYFCDIKE